MDNSHFFKAATLKHYGNCVGPLATIRCQPRQARKGATVAADSCAEMWLTWSPPNLAFSQSL